MLSSLTHLVLTLLFTQVFDWGFTGICVATSLQFATRFFIAVTLINKLPVLKRAAASHAPVHLFSLETTRNLTNQLRLGLGAIMMGIWGWWAFDILPLVASYISVTAVSAQTVMYSIGLMTQMIPVGFAVASQQLIGRNIGAGNKKLIKHYYGLCMRLALLVALA